MFCLEETQNLAWSFKLRLLFKLLHRKNGSNQVKLNFDVQPQKSNITKKLLPYNNGVIKITQKHVSKLGYRGMDCMQW